MSQINVLMSLRELSKHLGVSQRAIWGWAADGKFPAPIKLGRLRRWRREDIDAWLARKANEASGGERDPD